MDKNRRLIAQLLAFSRKQILKPVSTDVNDTISVFDALIERAVGENLSVRWLLGTDISQVNVDAAQLQSALLNLIVNAKDAMPKTGVIRIFTEMMYLASPNFVPPYDVPAGEYVVIGVKDVGKGMPKLLLTALSNPGGNIRQNCWHEARGVLCFSENRSITPTNVR